MMTSEEIKSLYGPKARISRVDGFTLVHLDNPSNELMERRAHDFEPNAFFRDDCPLCRMSRESGVVNPIETAVAPLKNEAIDRAEKEARSIVKQCREELKAAGNDLRAVAPYPNGHMDRFSYVVALSKYSLFERLTTWRKGSVSIHDPLYVDVDSNKVKKFVKVAREDAASQYDAFVAKLVSKIGEVQSASLEGNHVWSYSLLTVEKTTGKEVWKTQQIINVSKLGKVFNQWPTRKVRTG